jgi:hypothetical protein
VSGKKHNQELCERAMCNAATTKSSNVGSDKSSNVCSDEGDESAASDDWNIHHAQVADPDNLGFATFALFPDCHAVQRSTKKLHTEHRGVTRKWEKSGEHRGADDVLAGMARDLGGQFAWDKKHMHRFCKLVENHHGAFNAVAANLPDGAARGTVAKVKKAVESKATKGLKEKQQLAESFGEIGGELADLVAANKWKAKGARVAPTQKALDLAEKGIGRVSKCL